MRLVLVRHGDAHAGFKGPISGPLGCRGLTDLGREQARALRDAVRSGMAPGADAVVTSKLPRAIETAEIVASALGIDDVPQDCDLCEVHTGDADGVDWADYPTRFGSFDMSAQPDRLFAPGGDSWNTFHRRVDDVMHRLAREHAQTTVMAVTSAGVIAASLRLRFDGLLEGGPGLVPTNTGLTVWEFDEANEVWTLRGYDETSHL